LMGVSAVLAGADAKFKLPSSRRHF
jgi:hypothetical protein